MLHTFLSDNRAELISLCSAMSALRHAPAASVAWAEYGVPRLIDQMAQTLKAQAKGEQQGLKPAVPPAPGSLPYQNEICRTAMLNGGALLKQGLAIEQVVRYYGDLCQAVTGLADTQNMRIEVKEFGMLNRCLDDAIAGAVGEFSVRREFEMTELHNDVLNERLGFLAHELRNLIHTATLAVTAVKTGSVGLSGATGAILDRSLIGLRTLIDRSLAEVRIGAGMVASRLSVSVAELIGELQESSSLEAQARGCTLAVAAVDPSLRVNADREMLLSAISNLLQNAFKFTRPGSEVSLVTRAEGTEVRMAIQDHCGGLPPGFADRMFEPFTCGTTHRSGLGLGLSIARRSIEANDGTLSVEDLHGNGCVFTVSLPLDRKA